MNCFTNSLEKNHLAFYGNVKVQAYCVMSNHFHSLISYKETSKNLSDFARCAHGAFGYKYNKLHDRSGKVAESRFKSSLIENTEHTMRVHFYIEANPIRAGLATLETLYKYKFCSYRFYAFGIADEFSKYLQIPEWYLELGKTPHERQKRYRKLFAAYLGEEMRTRSLAPVILSNFIGSISWTQKEVTRCRAIMREQIKEKLAEVQARIAEREKSAVPPVKNSS